MSDLEQDLQHIMSHSGRIWQPLAGTNILITGGTGFVGSWLLQSILRANRQLYLNARVFLLTRDPQRFHAVKPDLAQNPNLELLPGDVKTMTFPRKRIHYIIHAAVEHQQADGTYYDTVAANLQGTRRVLELASACGTSRMLLTSSGAVYGEQPPEMDQLPEGFVGPNLPANSYAESKRQSEALWATASSSSVAIVIARLFAFVGPYLPLDKNYAVGNFVRDALMGGPIRIEGDGTAIRSYLYAADLAIWLWTLLVHGNSSHPYNVGSDQAVNILQLAQTVARVCGITRGISLAERSIAGEKPKRYVPSIQRARTQLGLNARIPLDEGIRRMYAWHQANSLMIP